MEGRIRQQDYILYWQSSQNIWKIFKWIISPELHCHIQVIWIAFLHIVSKKPYWETLNWHIVQSQWIVPSKTNSRKNSFVPKAREPAFKTDLIWTPTNFDKTRVVLKMLGTHKSHDLSCEHYRLALTMSAPAQTTTITFVDGKVHVRNFLKLMSDWHDS